MNILSRYIGRTIIKSTLLVLLIIIGLETFILLAMQLGSMGKGSYDIWQAILYVLLVLPQQTYQFFPMIALIGVLSGMSMLTHHSELIVMRAAGWSPKRIAYEVLKTGIIIVVIVTLVGEVLAPRAKYLAEAHKLSATTSGQALKTQQGLWLRQGQNFYHIKTIFSDKHIAGVSRYTFNDNQQLLSASVAQQGFYKDHDWQMQNIKESIIGTKKVSVQQIPNQAWYLALNPHLLHISQIQPEEMTLPQLAYFIHYRLSNHLASENDQLTFWQRILQPLASLIMMLLAIPFVFGSLRTVTTGLRLMLGIIVGFAFYFCNQLFPPLSQVYAFKPLIAELIPILLFATIGFFLLRKTN